MMNSKTFSVNLLTEKLNGDEALQKKTLGRLFKIIEDKIKDKLPDCQWSNVSFKRVHTFKECPPMECSFTLSSESPLGPSVMTLKSALGILAGELGQGYIIVYDKQDNTTTSIDTRNGLYDIREGYNIVQSGRFDEISDSYGSGRLIRNDYRDVLKDVINKLNPGKYDSAERAESDSSYASTYGLTKTLKMHFDIWPFEISGNPDEQKDKIDKIFQAIEKYTRNCKITNISFTDVDNLQTPYIQCTFAVRTTEQDMRRVMQNVEASLMYMKLELCTPMLRLYDDAGFETIIENISDVIGERPQNIFNEIWDILHDYRNIDDSHDEDGHDEI